MLTEILNFILIGFVQGVVEWLPISSQGNILVILTNFLNIPLSLSLDYSVYLHIGTIFAVLVYFRKDFLRTFSYKTIKDVTQKKTTHDTKKLLFLTYSVFFTTVMFCLLYFIYKDLVLLDIKIVTLIVALLLIVTGTIQLLTKNQTLIRKKLSKKNAFFVGLFQGFSIFPGISRSGITTSVLLFEKFSPKDAFKYSFLLSVPTIIVAEVGYIILNGFSSFSLLLLLSIFVSFIVGYFTIGLLLRFAEKVNFGVFCYILGVFYVFLFFL